MYNTVLVLADLEKYEEAIEKFEYALSLDEEKEETRISICLWATWLV